MVLNECETYCILGCSMECASVDENGPIGRDLHAVEMWQSHGGVSTSNAVLFPFQATMWCVA